MVKSRWRKIMIVVAGVIAGAAAIWYAVFGLKPYNVTPEQLEQVYSYEQKTVDIKLSPLKRGHFSLEYKSFDGANVNGQIIYPSHYDSTRPIPVMIGVHGMGRSYVRWIQDSFKGTDTKEQTDELANMALAKGYAVVVIDARNHGKRKNLDYSIKDVMYDLWFWGKREPYEQMIIDTVKDHRVLLDWIAKQAQFDQNKISVAGYSMGAQISLILASLDERVDKVLSIVPPHSSDTVALVAPLNVINALNVESIWLVTASNDEYASNSENIELFDAIPSQQKQHIVIEGEHVLPEGYYHQIVGWY